MYDSKRRCVFAARDPSGREPLYHCLDGAGGVSFTNTSDVSSAEVDQDDWEEVRAPAGPAAAARPAGSWHVVHVLLYGLI